MCISKNDFNPHLWSHVIDSIHADFRLSTIHYLCSFFKKFLSLDLLAESFVNLNELIICFIPRIWINAFANDLTQTSLVWYKLKPYNRRNILNCWVPIIDIISLRRLSTLKWARQLIFLNIVIWSLRGIPTLIFVEIRPSLGCSISNQFYARYYSIDYFYILLGFLPMSLMIIFSLIAFRNVRKIIRSQISFERWRLDRELTAMVLIRVAFSIHTFLCHSYYASTFSDTHHNAVQLALDQLIAMTISFAYSHYSVSTLC